MAIGKLADVASFDATFQTGMMETIAQNIRVFDQSRGTIRLIDERLGGSYSKRAVRRRLTSPISRRDPTSVSAATDIAATTTADVGVKLKRTFGPVANTRDAWNEMIADAGGSIEALALDYGRVAGEEMLKDQIDSALRALQASLANQADNLFTVASSGTMKTEALIDGLAKFGDAANGIVCWVMHSKAYYNLVKDQAVTTNIDGVSNFAVATATPVTMNRPVVVVDSEALVIASGTGSSATTDYYSLGLTLDACLIKNSRNMDVIFDNVTGLANLVTRVQAEYDYNIELKGFAWDITNGGANPTNAAVATGSNWDKTGTSHKHLPGIVIKSK